MNEEEAGASKVYQRILWWKEPIKQAKPLQKGIILTKEIQTVENFSGREIPSHFEFCKGLQA
jgi:hypothetical protein